MILSQTHDLGTTSVRPSSVALATHAYSYSKESSLGGISRIRVISGLCHVEEAFDFDERSFLR